MATAMGHGTEETQRVETRFKIQQFQHAPRLIGRDLRTASSSAKLRILLHPLQLLHSPEASNLGSRANEAIAALNRIAMSGTCVNTRCTNKRTNHVAKRGKTKHESLSMDQHEFSKTAGNKGNEECVKKQSQSGHDYRVQRRATIKHRHME